MPRHLLLHGSHIVKTALLTSGLCTAVSVTIAVAAGETAYSAWLGVLSALVGGACGVVAGLVAGVVRALTARGSASARAQRWAQALAGGTSAGTCAGLVLQAPALQEAVVSVGLVLVAAAAVHLSAVVRPETTARA
ncbi:hypothetical protein [Quadrisphaera setariae]|uniref:Uncharacterized protein n=1 Tax=Quadrisphaera setariae TaxID=2593304 RepID=A0A5C8ZJG4_9ACTN|nr:hypothetical protein [Quadrisphaera setariae]TXR56990.1 hypothetical protein FMM08_05705 [Quadrisphaera setariae]